MPPGLSVPPSAQQWPASRCPRAARTRFRLYSPRPAEPQTSRPRPTGLPHEKECCGHDLRPPPSTKAAQDRVGFARVASGYVRARLWQHQLCAADPPDASPAKCEWPARVSEECPGTTLAVVAVGLLLV